MPYIPSIVSFSCATVLAVEVFRFHKNGIDVEGFMGRFLVVLPILAMSLGLYFIKERLLIDAVPFLVFPFYFYVPNRWIWIKSLPKALLASLIYFSCVVILSEFFSVLLPWTALIIFLSPLFIFQYFAHPRRNS